MLSLRVAAVIGSLGWTTVTSVAAADPPPVTVEPTPAASAPEPATPSAPAAPPGAAPPAAPGPEPTPNQPAPGASEKPSNQPAAGASEDPPPKGCNNSKWCFVGGALLASFSLTTMWRDDLHAGSTSRRMVAIAMPMVGMRWSPLGGAVSLDLLVYTALMPTQTIGSAPANISGCHANGNTFESRLPCEGNATLTPVLGFFFPTLTVSPLTNFSAVSVGPTYGLARTNQDSAFHAFVGLLVTVGSAQLAVDVPGTSTASPPPKTVGSLSQAKGGI
jgi:hypothetical protein